ncbi:MAG TPA: response regulator [Terriglobia bacterium]
MSLIAAVDDLFFSARIRDTARRAGVATEIVATAKLPAALAERLVRGGAEAVILDLNSPRAVDLIRTLKADPQTRPVPIVGFASHVAADTIAAARAAGCDQVLARSAFTHQLPELLQRLAAGDRNG